MFKVNLFADNHLTILIHFEFITMGIFLDLEGFRHYKSPKLHHYGIRGNAHRWFASYLVNRQQYTEYRSAKSSSQILLHGVPQGSILGPLLF